MPKPLPIQPVPYGVIRYTIESDLCLNGVYTHPGFRGEIYNEIARKRTNFSGIAGDYDCQYFDLKNAYESCILEIRPMSAVPNGYEFNWVVKGGKKSSFEGRGYEISDKQLVVYYW